MTIARAVVAPAYGGPEVLEVREVEVPVPGPGEARQRGLPRLESRHLVAMAARGELVVPVIHTYPLDQAAAALSLLAGEHPGGKLALIP